MPTNGSNAHGHKTDDNFTIPVDIMPRGLPPWKVISSSLMVCPDPECGICQMSVMLFLAVKRLATPEDQTVDESACENTYNELAHACFDPKAAPPWNPGDCPVDEESDSVRREQFESFLNGVISGVASGVGGRNPVTGRVRVAPVTGIFDRLFGGKPSDKAKPESAGGKGSDPDAMTAVNALNRAVEMLKIAVACFIIESSDDGRADTSLSVVARAFSLAGDIQKLRDEYSGDDKQEKVVSA